MLYPDSAQRHQPCVHSHRPVPPYSRRDRRESDFGADEPIFLSSKEFDFVANEVGYRELLDEAFAGDIHKPYHITCEIQKKRVECAMMIQAYNQLKKPRVMAQPGSFEAKREAQEKLQ